MIATTKTTEKQIDYDLHGLVAIRLIDPSADDAAAVARQLGPLKKPLNREPDIVLRFVDQVPLCGRVRYLGAWETAYTNEEFLILRGKQKSTTVVQIPFDQVGDRCEIVCQSGLKAVPQLIPIINLTALAKGALPLHASAFVHNDTGTLVTGWAKGGKTETLLGFMAAGAEYVGDEWIYLTGDEPRMYGIPEPIRIWDWHLHGMPTFQSRVARKDRARLKTLQWAASTINRAAANRVAQQMLPTDLLRRLTPIVNGQRYVQMPPDQIFGHGARTSHAALDHVLFVVSHNSSETVVEPVDCEEVVERMVFSLQQERGDFMAKYMMFRFAFPDRANELIEQAESLQRERLRQLLAGKKAHVVYHPYPVSPTALFNAIQKAI